MLAYGIRVDPITGQPMSSSNNSSLNVSTLTPTVTSTESSTTTQQNSSEASKIEDKPEQAFLRGYYTPNEVIRGQNSAYGSQSEVPVGGLIFSVSGEGNTATSIMSTG